MAVRFGGGGDFFFDLNIMEELGMNPASTLFYRYNMLYGYLGIYFEFWSRIAPSLILMT